MKQGPFELEVLLHGLPAREYGYRGETFVEGRRGSEFTLRVRNNTDHKIVVVLAVDGLNVMNGKTASVSDGGYVIDPYDFVDVPGWTLNLQEVAHFEFSSLPASYAAQMDKPANVGVIGAAIFFEKERLQPIVYRSLDEASTTRHFGGLAEAKSLGNIGTAFGRRAGFAVTQVHFNREDHPRAKLVLRYDDARGLYARGIMLDTAHRDPTIRADAFPGDIGATPPPHWHG